MSEDATMTLASNDVTAQLIGGRGTRGGFSLVVDGTTQSHVNPSDPRDLQLPYVQVIGASIDEAFARGRPVTALHLGGGALTVPRYVAATRPGSRQRVVELFAPLIEFVVESLPLDSDADIQIVIDDARAHADGLSPADPRWDLVVVDVFASSVAPPSVTTVEFFRTLDAALSDDGVLVINTFTKHGLDSSRDALRTLGEVFPFVGAIGSEAVVRGDAVGNIEVVASHRNVDAAAIAQRVSTSTGSPRISLDGAAAAAFAVSGAVRRDETLAVRTN